MESRSDALQIKVTAKDIPLTKIGILSYTSSIFDPLGILAVVLYVRSSRQYFFFIKHILNLKYTKQ